MSAISKNLRMRLFAKSDSKILFFFLFLLPYVTFGLIAADNSPFYLLGILLLLFLFFLYNINATIGKPVLIAVLVSFGIVVLELGRGHYQMEVLKFVASFFLIMGLSTLPRFFTLEKIEGLILTVSVIWVTATFLTLLKYDIFSFLFFRVGGDITRGAAGLSTEPANWGQASAMMIILVKLGVKDKTKMLVAIILFTLSCLMSLSAFGLVYLILAFWFVLGFKKTFFLGIGGMIMLLLFLPQHSRLYLLITFLFRPEGWVLLARDESIFLRLNAFLTIPKILSNGLVFGQYFTGMSIEEARFSGARYTLSGINVLVFRYGIFGILLSIPILRIIFNLINEGLKNEKAIDRIPVYIIFLIILFVGPIAFPYFYLALVTSIIINGDK